MKFSILVILFSVSAFCKTKTIKMLTWWDYQAPAVIKKLEKNNFKIDLTLYKSNEVAFSKLVSNGNNFDVIIVSGNIVDSLKSVVKLNNLNDRIKNRKYLDFLILKDIPCVPYLWSATVFSVIGPEKISTLEELVQLKSKDYSITVLDEPFEVVGRKILDLGCGGRMEHGKIDWNFNKNCANFSDKFKNLEPGDIKSSTAEYLLKERSAAYGWHGELTPLLDKNLKLNIYLPAKNPVIGADYVCMVKNPNPNQARLVEKFVDLLTDKESTSLNMESTGYFSPFDGQTCIRKSKYFTIN